jgi:UDP-N-acetylmuramate dehydrogenase
MLSRLGAIPNLHILENVPLSRYTRFAIGGPARVLADASTDQALVESLQVIQEGGCPHTVIGGGTNLIASDDGYPGVVLRYTAPGIEFDGDVVHVEAGAVLQELVDATIDQGLRGLETMTGIPGWVGGAIYGNAGAYGHSINERVQSVRFFDGRNIREIGNAACEFRYRESIFKAHKEWIVLRASLTLEPADAAELQATADNILKIRNEKYPPTMRCAGSIFKNLLLAELPPCVRAQVPERVIREGKVPSAYFLEQAGAKGMCNGDIRVADYHANLIYNDGGGTARQVREMVEELKRRVRGQSGLQLEEEVQYVGDSAVSQETRA